MNNANQITVGDGSLLMPQLFDWHCSLFNDPSLCLAALAADGEACTANAQCQSQNCDVGGTDQCIAALAAIGEACTENAQRQSNNCDNGGTDRCI